MIRKLLAQLPYLPRALALVWSAARYWTLAWGLLLVVQGLLPVATVYLTRQVVDRLAQAVGSSGGRAAVQPLLLPLSLMVAVMLASRVLGSVTNWIRTAQSELVRDHISDLIHAQSVALDLAFYDSPDYYDRLHRARNDASYRPLMLLENLGSLFQNGITLVAMAAVLLRFGLWLPLALVVSALPAFAVLLQTNRREHQWTLRTTPEQRRVWYYDWLLTGRDPAAELRLYDLGPRFRTAYQALRRRLRLEKLQLAQTRILSGLVAGLLALVLSGLALGWTVWRAVQGFLTLGDLALLYQAFNQGQGLMRSLLENLGQVYSHSLFLGDLYDFLGLRPRVVTPLTPAPSPSCLREGICFEAVSFRYPGSERLALRSLDLRIPSGQKVALVGANGAGKVRSSSCSAGCMTLRRGVFWWMGWICGRCRWTRCGAW